MIFPITCDIKLIATGYAETFDQSVRKTSVVLVSLKMDKEGSDSPRNLSRLVQEIKSCGKEQTCLNVSPSAEFEFSRWARNLVDK